VVSGSRVVEKNKKMRERERGGKGEVSVYYDSL
jgi:hypothetical protein